MKLGDEMLRLWKSESDWMFESDWMDWSVTCSPTIFIVFIRRRGVTQIHHFNQPTGKKGKRCEGLANMSRTLYLLIKEHILFYFIFCSKSHCHFKCFGLFNVEFVSFSQIKSTVEIIRIYSKHYCCHFYSIVCWNVSLVHINLFLKSNTACMAVFFNLKCWTTSYKVPFLF